MKFIWRHVISSQDGVTWKLVIVLSIKWLLLFFLLTHTRLLLRFCLLFFADIDSLHWSSWRLAHLSGRFISQFSSIALVPSNRPPIPRFALPNHWHRNPKGKERKKKEKVELPNPSKLSWTSFSFYRLKSSYHVHSRFRRPLRSCRARVAITNSLLVQMSIICRSLLRTFFCFDLVTGTIALSLNSRSVSSARIQSSRLPHTLTMFANLPTSFDLLFVFPVLLGNDQW